jgi:hypothetical protein
MIDVNEYNNICGVSEIVNYTYPVFYVFKVTENDYTNTTVKRYFVQKINTLDIIEVNQQNYVKIPNSLYKKVFLTWKLIGFKNNVYKNGNIYEYGVYEQNLNAVNIASQTITNLNSYITDYTQYARFINN